MIQLLDVRRDFPILDQKVNGKRLVYLDSAATSQKPASVLQAMQQYYEEYNANIHRGLYTLSEIATRKYEEARRKIASFINASWRETVFVRNATEAINIVAHAYVKPRLSKGDTLLLTEMEHHSNLVPWQIIAKETGAKISYVPLTADGLLDVVIARKLLEKKPAFFALTHVSNVLGTITPVRELIQLAHEQGVPVLVDGAQSVPHMKVNVKELGADFYAFSGHKMFGPTGIGILYGKRELLERTEPLFGGGDMIKEVTYDYSKWNELPWKFEAGTPNIAGAIGLGAAVDYIASIGMEHIAEHNTALTAYALEKFSKLSYITVYGPHDVAKRNGVVSFNVGDVHAHDVTTVLDEEGIAIRSGHHCAMPLMEKLGVAAACRASFHVYNTFEDIDRLIQALEKVRKIFRL